MERLRLRIYDPRNGPVQIGYVSGGFRSGEDEYVPAAEVERLREALEASDALFEWIQGNFPAALVEAPTDIMQRLMQSVEALNASDDRSTVPRT